MGNINFLNVNSVNISSTPMSGVNNANREKDSTPAYIQNRSSRIKYKKIHASDKKPVFGNLPEDYTYTVNSQNTQSSYLKSPLLSITGGYGQFPQVTTQNVVKTFYKSCYELEDIFSPDRFQGCGTAAVQSLVEKSLMDKDTEGRVIVVAKVTDGETSPAGFFFKLGFRFIDKALNDKMIDWMTSNPNGYISPMVTGIMYLPKENINKVLMYKKLL